MKPALRMLNSELQKEEDPASWYNEWREAVAKKREEFPMWFPKRDDVIVPQWAIKASIDNHKSYAIMNLQVSW